MRVFLLITLATVVVTAYAPSFQGPMIFDDFQINRVFKSSWGDLNWARPETRPLLNLSFIIQKSFFNSSNACSRLLNVALLIGSAFLLFEILWRCAKKSSDRCFSDFSMIFAGTVCFAWALHPIQTECIAYIVQRAEALMGFFFFAFMLCLVLDHESKTLDSLAKKPLISAGHLRFAFRHRWQLLAVASFLCGVWSKTIMVTVLAVGPLFDRAFLSQSWSEVWRRRGLVFAVPSLVGGLAIASLIPGIMVGNANVGFGGNAPPVSLYLSAQCMIIYQYLGIILFPAVLSIDWGYAPPTFVSEMWLWIVLIVVWLMFTIAFAATGRWRLSFFLASPLLVLSPTSSFIPTADLMVEHRLYVPSAIVLSGLGVVVVLWLQWLAAYGHTLNRKLVVLVAIAYLVTLGSRTWIRCQDYQSEYRIWSQAVMANPSNNRAIQQAIDAADVENQQSRIMPLLLEATTALEKKGVLPIVPLQRIGEALCKAGRFEQSIQVLRKSIELDEQQRHATPEGYRDIQQQLNRSASHVNLAIALNSLNNHAESQAEIQHAIEYAPSAVLPRAIAGQFCREQGQIEDAISHFQAALKIDPNSPDLKLDIAELQQRIDARASQQPEEL